VETSHDLLLGKSVSIFILRIIVLDKYLSHIYPLDIQPSDKDRECESVCC